MRINKVLINGFVYAITINNGLVEINQWGKKIQLQKIINQPNVIVYGKKK